MASKVMAASAPMPDLSSITSSAQVFASTEPSYSLPQIRALHRSLHAQVDDKAARLRLRVGGSYRELLGTADSIVDMRRNMDFVQGVLAGVGARCGRQVVGAKVAALGSFIQQGEGAGGLGALARVRMLEGCALVVGSLLRGKIQRENTTKDGASDDSDEHGCRGERLVVAVKVLVLSRLLIKSFGDGAVSEGPVIAATVEAAKKSLASLRRKVFRSIDKILSRVGDSSHQADMLNALSAYSLATSSGVRDVLWYFLHIRAEAIALLVGEGHRAQDALQCLSLYTKTLLDVQSLVPYKLTQALTSLKKSGLLADPSLRAIEALRLDVHERWCGDDILHFTPFIRTDDLDSAHAKNMLAGWAAKGSAMVLQALENSLAGMTEFGSVVALRTDLLRSWIAEGGRAKGFDPAELLQNMRAALNRQLIHVLDTKVHKLRLIGSEIAATLEAWQDDKHVALWDLDGYDLELVTGASRFVHEVLARLNGRSDAVSRAVDRHESWVQVVTDVGHVVEQLRRQRWDGDVEEIEDEESIAERQAMLSREDPQALSEHLDSALAQAFNELDARVKALWRQYGGDRTPVAIYLLRVLRDVRKRLPESQPAQEFGLELVPDLHGVVVAHVTRGPMEALDIALARRRVTGRALWEGEPALPTGPSPGVLRFLRRLVVAMGEVGGDLWSGVAVGKLKKRVRSEVRQAWMGVLEAVVTEAQDAALQEAQDQQEEKARAETDGGEAKGYEGEGKSETEDQTGPQEDSPDGQQEVDEAQGKLDEVLAKQPDTTAEQNRDLFIQWLFDIAYLGCALGCCSVDFADLEDSVYKATELEGSVSEGRQLVHKAAQDYWKRTSLLFGLLA